MIFIGPYENPAVLAVPGNIAPETPIVNRLSWGEKIVFQIPDPESDCLIKLLIKADIALAEALIEVEFERIEDGDVELSVSSTESIKYLYPGIFFFQVVYVTAGENEELSYAMGNQGVFELIETAGSSVIPRPD
jgi:hypothetical protein